MSFFRQLLLGAGYTYDRVSSTDDILSTIELLKPRDVGHELIRIGGEGDGGYLVPDDLQGIAACFSPGVSTTADFEEMLATSYGIRSYLADFSVDAPPLASELMEFDKKYLGVVNDEVYLRLEDWVDSKVGPEGDLLLQMDIEGAEYPVLIDATPELLRRFRIIVIEFHALQQMFGRRSLNLLKGIFHKLANDFTVAHAHPNNHRQIYHHAGIEIPANLEITLLRNDRVRSGNRVLTFPHPLDHPNVPGKEDVVLPVTWRQEIP